MKNEKIYVIGHRNPDTDSICSAIAYAYLKNKAENTDKYIAARQGKINYETHFIFKYFKYTVLPHLMDDARNKKIRCEYISLKKKQKIYILVYIFGIIK